jgi:hypothetical protein
MRTVLKSKRGHEHTYVSFVVLTSLSSDVKRTVFCTERTAVSILGCNGTSRVRHLLRSREEVCVNIEQFLAHTKSAAASALP